MNPEQAATKPFAGRVAAPLAWSLCALTLTAVACAFWLAALNRYDPRLVTYVLGSALGGPVGALVASRRPENIVGWLVIGGSLSWALLEFARQYATYGLLTEPGSLPFARAVAWPPNWLARSGLCWSSASFRSTSPTDASPRAGGGPWLFLTSLSARCSASSSPSRRSMRRYRASPTPWGSRACGRS